MDFDPGRLMYDEAKIVFVQNRKLLSFRFYRSESGLSWRKYPQAQPIPGQLDAAFGLQPPQQLGGAP